MAEEDLEPWHGGGGLGAMAEEDLEPEECPVCFEVLTSSSPPLHCGHTLCSSCEAKLCPSRCPLRRAEFQPRARRAARATSAASATTGTSAAGAGAYNIAMLEAAQEGQWEEARALLSAGADPNQRSRDPRASATALHHAAATGVESAVRFLLDGGADIEARDAAQGMATPLIWASYNDRRQVIRQLLAAGANHLGVDRFGSNACQWAVARGHMAAARMIAAHHEEKVGAGRVEWLSDVGSVLLT